MKGSTFGFVLLLAVGIALGAGGAYWWLARSNPALSLTTLAAPSVPVSKATAPANDARIAVDVTSVEKITLARSADAVGSLSSENSVMLRPEITGRITAINFQEGGHVEQGQVLVELDGSVARAQLAQAQASLALVSSQYRRAKELTTRGFISAQARDESASQLKVQQAAVALAKAQLEKTIIIAPFDGLIGLRLVSTGDYVSPGTDLVPLESIDPLNVDFRIPEHFLGLVKVGTRISLRFDALADVTRDGVVGAISPLLDVGGRSMLLRAKVANDDGALRPGMFARVKLEFAGKETLMVPEAAIAPAGDMNYVYRVDDGRAVKVGVMLGQRREGKVEIIDGLQNGDNVLITGLQKVFDGAEIHTRPATGSD